MSFFRYSFCYLLMLISSALYANQCTTGLPSVVYFDDFSSLDAGWHTSNFNRNISNWPSDSIFNTAGENQNVAGGVGSGRLYINGTVTSGNDNEYGMVYYDLSTIPVSTSTTVDYAISTYITADRIGLNNDVGIVFGFNDDQNYYLARWNKYGTSYASDTNFPGVYRRLELVKVSNGVVTQLGFVDNFSVGDPFKMAVVVDNTGTTVCINDNPILTNTLEQPAIKNIGIFSYDNDDGISIDNFEVRCDNCTSLPTPLVNYRFDECSYTGVTNEVIDQQGNYHATSFAGLTTFDAGQVERAAGLTIDQHHFETSILLPASFSVSAWFKKPTATTGNRYFILGAMQSGGDLLFLDRSNNWRWGVYNPATGVAYGSFSFASLDNNWHHIALVYSGGQTKLYIDGSFIETVNRVPSGTLKFIGTSYDQVNTSTPQGFRAPIDEFIVFGSALSADHIQTIYTNQLAKRNYDGTTRAAVNCSNLLALYSFEQTSFTSNILDTSGYNNHATNINGASIAAGRYCRGFDSNATNSTSATNNAFNTNLDLETEVGAQGTISFWFKSNTDWNQGGYNGGERTLFDASNASTGKYFGLEISSNGFLHYSFEDSVDSDFYVDEPTNSSLRTANTWYYITATWNYSTNNFQLYVDGNLRVSQTVNTNNIIGNMGNLIFGDNASTYSANGHIYLLSTTSANGQFDEVRIYNKVLTQAEIQADMNDKAGCISIDHFLIEHDGTGLTCDVEPITIKACADSLCSTLASDNVSLNLLGNGVVKASTSFSQQTTVNIKHTLAEVLTLDIANPSITPTNNTVCSNGSTASCDINFADTGFRFLVDGNAVNIPTQLSAKPSNTGYHSADIKLQAVQTNTATGACEAALVNNVTIEMAAKCTNPIACAGQSVTINGTTINTLDNASTLAYTNITLNFADAATNAATTVIQYPDAGRVQLYARYNIPDINGDPSGNYMLGNSNGFVVRPFAFAVNVSGNPAAQTSSQSVFKKAGENFSATVTAVQWQSGQDTNNDGLVDIGVDISGNSATPNFGHEINAEIVNLTSNLVAPLGGNNPALVNATFTGFNSGSVTRNDLSWGEVGIISIDANLSDVRYIGTSDIQGNVPYVGRFIPHHFEQTVKSHGSLKGLCGAWVYAGQKDEATQLRGAIDYASGAQPQLRITAYNQAGAITKNYSNDSDTGTGTQLFMRLPASNINLLTPTQDVNKLGVDGLNKTKLTGSYVTGTLAQEVAGISNGGTLIYTLNALDHFTYNHEANSELAPYTATIPVALNTATTLDSDGVTVTSASQAEPSGVEIRFGRMSLENSYGPETSNIAQFLSTQYLAASGQFITNTDDNCTSFNAANMSLTDGTLSASLSAVLAPTPATGTFSNGKNASIALQATGAGNLGTINVNYSVFPWLKYRWNSVDENGDSNFYDDDPTAVATFGIFRGNDRVIYWREKVN